MIKMLLIAAFACFKTIEGFVVNNSVHHLKGNVLKCMKCGGEGYPEQNDVFSLCLTFGKSIECQPGHVCTRMELHFTYQVEGVKSNDVMGCAQLHGYREECGKSVEELGQELNLPLKRFSCYHCMSPLCNADKDDMLNTREEVATTTPPTPPDVIEEMLWCYRCGYFSLYSLKYIVACTGEQELMPCGSSDEVCGFIYIELHTPLYGRKGTVYHVKQCIHREAYRTRFEVWTRNIQRLRVRDFTCYYCENDGCNTIFTNMTNILSRGSYNPAYTTLTLISILLLELQP